LFPSMREYGAILETYNNVGFYGLNKKQLGVRVIG